MIPTNSLTEILQLVLEVLVLSLYKYVQTPYTKGTKAVKNLGYHSCDIMIKEYRSRVDYIRT